MEYRLFASGSQENDYEVIISVDGTQATIKCSCFAGLNGTLCKHRIALLLSHEDQDELDSMYEYDDTFIKATEAIWKTTIQTAYKEHLEKLDTLKKEYKKLENSEKKRFAKFLAG